MSGRVLDLGAGEDPDPRATETVDIASPADHRFDLSETWGLSADSAEGIVMNHVIEHLDAEHVFAEAGRVLVSGGWFEVTVPLGDDADTDNGHVTKWKWATPNQYCREDRRPWDPDTEFVLVEKEIDVWLGGPFWPATPLFQAAANIWPGWGVHRCFAGELTARYRRV